MSIEATSWAMDLRIPPVQKLTLIMIAECTDHEGCYELKVDSREWLGGMVGIKPDQVDSVLTELHFMGLIGWDRKSDIITSYIGQQPFVDPEETIDVN